MSLAKNVTRSLTYILIGLGSVACGQNEDYTSASSKAERVAQLAAKRIGGSDTVLAVVISPSTCFSCSELVLELVTLAFTEPSSAQIMFTRRPTDGEQSQLSLQRIKPVTAIDERFADGVEDFVALVVSDRAKHSAPLKGIITDTILLNYITLRTSNR